jgi:hypothetical protein
MSLPRRSFSDANGIERRRSFSTGAYDHFFDRAFSPLFFPTRTESSDAALFPPAHTIIFSIALFRRFSTTTHTRSPAHCNQQAEVGTRRGRSGTRRGRSGTRRGRCGTRRGRCGTRRGRRSSRRLSKNPPHMYIILFIGTPWVHQACTGANTQMGGQSSCGGGKPQDQHRRLVESTPRQEPAGIARNTAGGRRQS